MASKRCIEDGLVQQNSNGRTSIDLCKDEDTILRILSTFDHTRQKLAQILDNEGKNIFHHYAKKDFNRAIGHLIKKLPSIEIRSLNQVDPSRELQQRE